MGKINSTLGIDLGGSSIKWGVISLDGELLNSGKEEVSDRSVENVIKHA